MRYLIVAAAGAALLAGCAESDMNDVDLSNVVTSVNVAEPETTNIATPEDNVAAEAPPVTFVWPSTLRVMGDGYPASGDPCRRLGETSATVDYLDHTATLVGCPTQAAPDSIKVLLDQGGTKLGEQDGVTFINVPTGK